MSEKISIIQGNITALEVDAIVNAANTSLLGGSGVDGAIHRAAGKELVAECRLLRGCKTGQAKLTKGYKLPAKYVIHTVGPVWQGGTQGEAELLASCYVSSLKLATENKLKTVAFPAISCGAYRYPAKEAAKIAIASATNFLKSDSTLDKILFVCFSNDIYQTYLDTAKAF